MVKNSYGRERDFLVQSGILANFNIIFNVSLVVLIFRIILKLL